MPYPPKKWKMLCVFKEGSHYSRCMNCKGRHHISIRSRIASYPGPEKGPGIYCLRMHRHPTFLWGIGNYSNLVRVS